MKMAQAGVLALVLGLLPGTVSGRAGPDRAAQAALPVTSTAVSHGVKITLTVRADSYPLRSLVRMVVTVENVSRKVFYVLGSICTGLFTHTLVLNRKGQPYPWPLPTYPIFCPKVQGSPLEPGKSVVTSSVVFLESGTLQAVANISSRKYDVTGKPLTVGVYQTSEPEHATLAPISGSPGKFAASIWPVPKNSGKLYYAEIEQCDNGHILGGAGGLPNLWSSTSTSRVTSSILGNTCKHEEWHLIAGWLGYPAARLDFTLTTT